MGRSRTVWMITVLAVLAWVACLMVNLHATGELPLIWQTQSLHNLRPEKQYAYSAPLRTGFCNSNDFASKAQLLEDGQPLSLGYALHSTIRDFGKGSYSVWDGRVIFATSDNTDPRTNGRHYEVRMPYPVTKLQWVTLVAVAVALTLLAAGLAGARLGRREDLALAAKSQRAWEWIKRVCGTARFAEAVLVFAAALSFQLVNYLVHFRDPALARLGMNILGTPYSDSIGWDSLGKSIAAGHGMIAGWEANRPFYGIFLGLFYTWTGGGFELAVLLNLVLVALTTVLVFRIGETIFTKWVGLVAALSFCLNLLTGAYALTVATETLGLFFLVWTPYLLILGLREGRGWLLVGAGVCLGLSNLTRPLTIFAFPAYLVCVLGFGWRAVSFRRGVAWMIMLSLGLAITLGPWLVRQRYLHGITTISYNTADALYCATTPRYGGTWAGEVFLEVPPELTSIKDRYDWFMNRAIANIKTNPSYYISNVAHAFGAICAEAGRNYLGATLYGTWLLALLIFLSHPPATRWRALLAGLAAGAVLLASEFWAPHQVKFWGSLSGLALCAWLGRSRLGLLLTATAVFSVLGIAIFGMAHPDLRLLLLIEWSFILGYYALASRVLSLCILGFGTSWGLTLLPGRQWEKGWVGRSLVRIPRFIADSPRIGASTTPNSQEFGCESSCTHEGFLQTEARSVAWPAWFKGLCALVGVYFVVSGCRIAHLNIKTDVPESATHWYGPDRARSIAHELAQRHPGALPPACLSTSQVVASFSEAAPPAAGAGKVFAAPCRLTRYRYHLPAQFELGQWSRFMQRRTYDRTVAYVEMAGGVFPKNTPYCYPLTISGQIPDSLWDRDCTVLGFVLRDESYPMELLSWEGIAIIPHDAATGELVYEEAYLGDDQRHLHPLLQRMESSDPGLAIERMTLPTLTESHD